MGRAMTCHELKAYLRTPVFLNVFSLLVPSLRIEKKIQINFNIEKVDYCKRITAGPRFFSYAQRR